VAAICGIYNHCEIVGQRRFFFFDFKFGSPHCSRMILPRQLSSEISKKFDCVISISYWLFSTISF